MAYYTQLGLHYFLPIIICHYSQPTGRMLQINLQLNIWRRKNHVQQIYPLRQIYKSEPGINICTVLKTENTIENEHNVWQCYLRKTIVLQKQNGLSMMITITKPYEWWYTSFSVMSFCYDVCILSAIHNINIQEK